MNVSDELRKRLLVAPQDQMSETMRDWIREWSSPPTLTEIIDTRNRAAYTSECSDFVIGVLNSMIDMAEKEAGAPL